MRYLGIDFGLKRVGLAISHPSPERISPLKTLRRTTRQALFAELVDCILEHQIQGVVIGLPLDLDGQETESSRQARNFGSSLARRIGLPIYFADEVLSSNEAERRLRQAGISLRQRQELIDQQAAVIILETFLANKDQGQQPR